MWNKLKFWWRAEGDLARLQGLGDRLLADMGLDRADLRNQVHGRPDPSPEPRDSCRHPLRAAPVAK
jgi:hypothetical protein